LIVAAALLALHGLGAHADMEARIVPAPTVDLPAAGERQVATLSGGCFWGIQGVFEHVKGVERAVSGYAGGTADTADYATVSSGKTGHAETVQITYDPRQISFGRILQIFFSVALDPTQLDRQGPDSGPQYRSEIWTADADQARVAHAYLAQLEAAHVWPRRIATRVDALAGFYPAEAYHQDYLLLHPHQPYIALEDMPKVEALERLFPEMWRADAVTVLPQKPAS
jgi:peptide-methionine (S)-S-oxide reductase